jgi:hypothetical protein
MLICTASFLVKRFGRTSTLATPYTLWKKWFLLANMDSSLPFEFWLYLRFGCICPWCYALIPVCYTVDRKGLDKIYRMCEPSWNIAVVCRWEDDKERKLWLGAASPRFAASWIGRPECKVHDHVQWGPEHQSGYQSQKNILQSFADAQPVQRSSKSRWPSVRCWMNEKKIVLGVIRMR